MTTATRLSFARFLAVALVSALTAASLYVALFFFQLGPYMPADYWIRDAFILKEYLAERTEGGPKILVMAGSGSLFGVDSGLVERETGRRTVNLAINGGLGFDFIAKQTRRVVEPRDVVLAPLEPSFIQLPMIPQWFFNNVMAWGDWYFDSLSTREKARFLFSVDPVRIVAGGLNRCLDGRVPEQIRWARRVRGDEIISQMENIWKTGSTPETLDQPYKRLTSNGDLESGEELDREFRSYYRGYLSGDARVRPEFVRLYTAFRDELDEMDVRLILLWPATMTDEQFDLSREADREVVAAFRENLGRHGIRVVGSPLDAHYPRELFFDSNFHLNGEGKEIHTRRIVQLLRTEVPDLFTAGSCRPQTSGEAP